MKEFWQKHKSKFFDGALDFRIRLFNILALGGIAVSILTVAISLITHMWATAGIAGFLVFLSLGLVLFTQKTGKFRIAQIVTVVVIFMLLLPLMFVTSGGHNSGMPSVFLFAVVFTILMLKGRAAIIVSLLEIAEYAAVFVFAYYHPQYVTHFESEWEVLVDVIFASACVSVMCGLVLYFHLKEYDRQRQRLKEQNDKLKRYDASRSAFITTVSHEIKNPLNAINLYARDTAELTDESPIDTAEIKNNQQVIENMVVRIDNILTDLKDTVAIEQGRLSLSLAPMRLAMLLKEASAYFGKNNTMGNKLVLNLDETLPPIDADYARLTQVVINILSNAMQHTKQGTIVISLSGRDGQQVVAVADDGEGMKEEVKSKVFSGYISDSEDYWRHGIGLFVCHQIVEAHGGKISIESSLGKGTTVTFALPERSDTNE